jgi:hypothetical protein
MVIASEKSEIKNRKIREEDKNFVGEYFSNKIVIFNFTK